MSTEQKGHYATKKLSGLHKKVADTTEGGACLTGHQASFKNKNGKCTCNYRYQGYEYSKSNGAIKNKLHGYSTKLRSNVATSAPMGKNGRFPAHYCAQLAPPRKNDWHIGGPDQDITRKNFKQRSVPVKKGMNFTQDTWPYWNNAHHIIPKGTLKERITEEDAVVSDLIQQCLLEAKYNINHKINVVLLPQDLEVANILGIPRHLQLQHADGSVSIAIGNHPVYNKMVLDAKRGLDTIVQDFAKICKDAITKAKKKHKVPKAQLSKKKLENLSKRLLKWILAPTKAGVSIDARAKKAGMK